MASNSPSKNQSDTMLLSHQRVLINVGGKKFSTFRSTLENFPSSRLGQLTNADVSYDTVNGEYFFDRNPIIFQNILDFYRKGELHFPHFLCGPIIESELEYWKISKDFIAPCCWRTYNKFADEQNTMKILEDNLQMFNPFKSKRINDTDNGLIINDNSPEVVASRWMYKIWKFLEDKPSTFCAKLWTRFYVFLILTSLIVLCLETHQNCRIPLSKVETEKMLEIRPDVVNITNVKIRMFIKTRPHTILSYVDYFCTIIFSLELLLRFIVWPNKLRFFNGFFNVLDVISILPMLVLTISDLIDPFLWIRQNIFIGYCVLSLTSVFRAIRVLKLVRHNYGARLLFLAIKSTTKHLLLLVLLMFIGAIVFSTMIYYAEINQPTSFQNIPVGIWWSIVTMTTVGYGDQIPTSSLGYIVGSMCAVAGVLSIGLPIPVIANSFQIYHKYAVMQMKMQSENSTRKALSKKSATYPLNRWAPLDKNDYRKSKTDIKTYQFKTEYE